MMQTRQFLGMHPTDASGLSWELEVLPGLSTPGSFLFGGCGLAAGIVAMEEATGRSTVWATSQYLSFAPTGSCLRLDVIPAVVGRRTTQARSIGSVGDKDILTVHGAFGEPRGEVDSTWVSPPSVDRPEYCPPRQTFSGEVETVFDKVETRQALGRSFGESDEGASHGPNPHSAIWARVPGHLGMEAAALAVFGDLVAGGVSQVLGRPTHGSSLDNTLRVVALEPTEWVLCDIHITALSGGYAQGHAFLWSEAGRLLATASQSMSVSPQRSGSGGPGPAAPQG